ncbi:MAG: D-alanyl-D-alanine carboxypeptidase, partial [Rhodanobacteraceae bacterium]
MKRCVAACAAAILLGGCASVPPPKQPAAHPPQPITRPASPVPNAASPRYAPSSLADGIDAFVSQPRFARAQWGIDVVSLDSGATLYRHNADALFLPASNAKLYTAALALQALGAGARFSTTLYATAAPRADGSVPGDLILYGGGDPSLGDRNVSPDWADRLAG